MNPFARLIDGFRRRPLNVRTTFGPGPAGQRHEIRTRQMVCGRRFDGLAVADWPRHPERDDRWAPAGAQAALVCSYCGSLHPEILLARLQLGYRLAGSDKPYKWYLQDPDDRTVGKFYTTHLNRLQAEDILRQLGDDRIRHTLYVRPFIPALASRAPGWLRDG